ncbi:LysE family transporter [Paenibacillus macerans]|uniref:LysE family transporter n=1 Tax=Paenibacillus macerans TaxID=44252 RepID=UPI003D319B0D
MLIRGFKFGMLLQLAVGPVCLFIFQTGSNDGFLAAEYGVLGVVLVDGLFMLAAMLGIGPLLEHEGIRPVIQRLGAAILFLFGLSMVLGSLGIALLPNLGLSGFGDSESGAFVYAVLLTASNPLTILFWAGVFATKMSEMRLPGAGLSRFALGALLATFAFLSSIALLGSLTYAFFTPLLSQALNLVVGLVLLVFAVRMAWTKNQS